MGRFKATAQISGPIAARVTMTLMAMRALLYSVVRCPARVMVRGHEVECNKKLMDVPGDPVIHARIVQQDHASGRGRILFCPRCRNWIEVIEHR